MEQAPARVAIPCVLLLFAGLTHAGSGAAQSRIDSTAIGRLIAVRALQDAKRQSRDIRTLVFVLKSHLSQRPPSPAGYRLLELAVDSIPDTLQKGRAICPWFVGGQLEPKMEIILENPTIANDQAAVDVQLRCSGGVLRRDGFVWWFTYVLQHRGKSWSIAEVIERAIT